ncbi:MAG: sugar ABC transporter permease [Candidatus Omnitrophota bacterium]|nr:MAG: sugar ABC transporter permease [Candidatus Omnitrophota bacterium]
MRRAANFKDYRFELLLILPLALYVIGFTLGPIIYAILLSFQEQFTNNFSLKNYYQIFSHFQFKNALINTFAITILSLILELCVGLFLAVLLTRRFIGKGLLRALMLLPLGVPTIVSAANMRYIFDSQGYLNEFLSRLHLINLPIDWTGGGGLSIFTLALADAWKVTPLVMLILIAGLETIPLDLFEAARVDGASFWQAFRRITLPLLKPFITIPLIVRGIDAFRLFELPLTLVGSSTPVLSTYTYFEYFQYNNPYTAAASAVILLIMIIISATIYLKISRERKSIYNL